MPRLCAKPSVSAAQSRLSTVSRLLSIASISSVATACSSAIACSGLCRLARIAGEEARFRVWLGLRLGLNEPALLCDRFILQRQQKWQRQQQWAAAGGSQVGGAASSRNVAKTAGARQFGAAYEDASVSARVWCTRHMAKSKSVPTHSSSMRTRDPSALHPTASAFQTGKVRANFGQSQYQVRAGLELKASATSCGSPSSALCDSASTRSRWAACCAACS